MTDKLALKFADPRCKAVLGDDEPSNIRLQHDRVAVGRMNDAHEIAEPLHIDASTCADQHFDGQSRTGCGTHSSYGVTRLGVELDKRASSLDVGYERHSRDRAPIRIRSTPRCLLGPGDGRSVGHVRIVMSETEYTLRISASSHSESSGPIADATI